MIDDDDDLFEAKLAQGYFNTTIIHLGLGYLLCFISCIFNPVMFFSLMGVAASLSAMMRVVKVPDMFVSHLSTAQRAAVALMALGPLLLVGGPLVLSALLVVFGGLGVSLGLL